MMKRKLEGAYSDHQMQEQENEVKDKELLIEQLVSEIKAVRNVDRHQNKALVTMKKEGPTDEYVDKVKEMLISAKQDFRKELAEYKEEDKRIKEQHLHIVSLQEK